MDKMNIRKAAMIGCGFVGASSAFALMQSGIFSEMVMIDADHAKAEGEDVYKRQGPAVSRTLKTLEDKGYIERDVNKADRRNTYVKLTASGEQKQEECEQIMSSFAHAVISKIDRDDMEQLIDCLNELYEASREEIEDRKMRQKGE